MDVLIHHKKKKEKYYKMPSKKCGIVHGIRGHEPGPGIIQIDSTDLIKLSAFWFDPLISVLPLTAAEEDI